MRVCYFLNSYEKKRVQNAYFDYEYMRWCDGEYLLPVNPYKGNSPVFSIPKDFLNMLPEIKSEDSKCSANTDKYYGFDY